LTNGACDRSQPLTIDPVLSYSTFLGGSGVDEGHGVAVDASGSAYVTGHTLSPNFPTAGAIQAACATNTSGACTTDAFVTKLDPLGQVVWSTYLGGSGTDRANAIAVDSAGRASLTGSTTSTNFPTASPVQATFGGDSDAFVTRLSASGNALLWSTYLGGRLTDIGYGIALDSAGNTYLTGDAGYYGPQPFPTTANAWRTTSAGSVDVFVTKLNASGSTLLYSSYFGSPGGDHPNGIAVDGAGHVAVTGSTNASGLPPVGAAQTSYGGGSSDGLVAVFDPSASGTASLLYSSYLGGATNDVGNAIAADGAGRFVLTGQTNSSGFPTVSALQPTKSGGDDAFVSVLDPTTSGSASLVYSTFLGGAGNDAGKGVALDAFGNIYLTGLTWSSGASSFLAHRHHSLQRR